MTSFKHNQTNLSVTRGSLCEGFVQTCSLTCEASPEESTSEESKECTADAIARSLPENCGATGDSELFGAGLVLGASLWFLGLPFDNLRCMSRSVCLVHLCTAIISCDPDSRS